VPTVPFPLIIALIVLIILLLVLAILKSNWVNANADEVKVISGWGPSRRLRNAGGFKLPLFQTVKQKSLTPIPVEIKVENVVDANKVPVSVTGSAQVSVGPSDPELKLFTDQYLTLSDAEIEKRVNEIVNGDMRSIIATMTVEDLSADRAALRAKVLESAEASLRQLGMIVTNLSINTISDANKYITSLGEQQIAKVKMDAAIATAHAERETKIQQAIATREAAVAQAEAETATKEAEKNRDIKIAEFKAEVDARNAEAAQQGPLAQAKAEAAVAVAQADADRQREEAQIAVESQRALRATKKQQVETVIPAEAQKQADVIVAEGRRQAAVLEAEGQRDAAIANATATSQSRTLESAAEAEAKTVLATARLAELTAEADGQAATMKAQAEGQTALAAALGAFSEASIRQQILPDLIKTLPAIIAAAADPLGNIDKVVMIGGGGSDGKSQISGFAGNVPMMIAAALESAKASGLDVGAFLHGLNGTTSEDSATPATAPTLSSSDVSDSES